MKSRKQLVNELKALEKKKKEQEKKNAIERTKEKPKYVKQYFEKYMRKIEEFIEEDKERRFYRIYGTGVLETEAIDMVIIKLKELGYDVDIDKGMTHQTMMVGDSEFVDDLKAPMIPCISVVIRW